MELFTGDTFRAFIVGDGFDELFRDVLTEHEAVFDPDAVAEMRRVRAGSRV